MSKPRSNPLRLISHMLASLFNSRAAFYREWERYDGKPGRDPVEGRWQGEWISERNGHRGELKCVLVEAGPECCRAYFYATFSKLFRVGYETDLKREQTEKGVRLRGEQNLGALAGGTYRSEGEVQGDQFICHYSCKYDQGRFQLRRVT
ncbi:MAG TPA: hypothetical protein VL793_14120 [Patescibacteria group bacterium]|nr:hypothetical protein [Patescibacteria group bacterium]